MLWCHLHGVVLKQQGRGGRVHTSDSIKAALNFPYEEYEGEVDELRGRGLHSFTLQLNVSRVLTQKTPYTP